MKTKKTSMTVSFKNGNKIVVPIPPVQADDWKLGKVAYEAYRKARRGKSMDMSKIPPWEDAQTYIQVAWIKSAVAVAKLSPAPAKQTLPPSIAVISAGFGLPYPDGLIHIKRVSAENKVCFHVTVKTVQPMSEKHDLFLTNDGLAVLVQLGQVALSGR